MRDTILELADQRQELLLLTAFFYQGQSEKRLSFSITTKGAETN
ncbi:TPA: hypothetical protein ACV44D_003092 [Enterococcus faecium]